VALALSRFGSCAVAFTALAAMLWTSRRRCALGVSRLAPVLGLFLAAACGGDGGPGSGGVPDRVLTPDEQGTVRTLGEDDTLLFSDQLGSLLAETSPAGAVKGRFAAYPFGATRHDSASQTRKFANSVRDGGVGLDLMGARVYAPDLGIWTAGDPVLVNEPERVATAEFATANPYAYANLNPVAAADGDGHFWHILAGAAIGAVIGGGVEAARQYVSTGKVEDWGRVGAAASAGLVGGALTAACPAAGFAGVMAVGAGSGAVSGVTDRLVASGGRSAGTLKDVAVDASVGAVTAGLAKGAVPVLKTLAQRMAPKLARAVSASTEETVSVFHGSIKNGDQIRKHGLDPARLPTSVTRDIAAARDALQNHYDAIPGMGQIVESRIPASKFNELFASAEREYKGFHPYRLNSTEIQVRSVEQVKVFNQHIVK